MILDLSKKSVSLIKKAIDTVLYDLVTFVYYQDESVEELIKNFKFLRSIISEQENEFDKIKE